ncbi:MAG: MBL fold metallo-hydrolase [Oligoflexia bacterium]|nr:MBL fold metallo-hydrolase [Oligoflexia bacterium]
MKITMHRGAKTIGGTCIEIEHEGTRIIIDMGIPLMDSSGKEIDKNLLKNPTTDNGILPRVSGLYKEDIPTISAVLVSHHHQDHYGLINHVHPSIPIYASQGTKELIEIGNIFCGPKVNLSNIKIFEHWKEFYINSIIIKSYLMDHSGFDASAFLIGTEKNRNTIFYTGDFRAHGNKGNLFKKMIGNPFTNLKVLILEGTNFIDIVPEYPDEKSVKNAFIKLFKNQSGPSFICSSGSNIDRIVNLYKAIRTSRKILVIDLYSAFVLDRLKTVTTRIPQFNWRNIRVYFEGSHKHLLEKTLGKSSYEKFESRIIKIEDVALLGNRAVIKIPPNRIESVMRRVPNKTGMSTIVYSMWKGYLKNTTIYDKLCTKHGMDFKYIHTTGHAYREDLVMLANVQNEESIIIPVHTCHGDDYEKYFRKERVVKLEDSNNEYTVK